MDARARLTYAPERTAKSCGSDAAVLALSLGRQCFSRGDGGKRAVLRGEHEVSRKAIAQGRPECSRCPVCSCALFVCANRTRDRGCSKHPVFPAPSDFEEGKRRCKPRANASRDREGISTSLRAQRSNPSSSHYAEAWIASLALRNDGESRVALPHKETGIAKGHWTPPGVGTGLLETGWKPERTECRILQCSKAINMAPANGQWQFGSLLCIGATGMQASEPSCRALQK